MAIEHQHGRIVRCFSHFGALAVIENKRRNPIARGKLSTFGSYRDDAGGVAGVMDEDVTGDAVTLMFADENGHSIDNVDEHIFLQHNCRNVIADFELQFFIGGKGRG